MRTRRVAADRSAPGGSGDGSPRVVASVVACVVALGLLSSGTGTWARWADETRVSLPPVGSGTARLVQSEEPVLQLLSRQPTGSRSYVSSRTCPTSGDVVECRVVSSTLGAERLVPGDEIRITQPVTMAVTGQNLRGLITVDAREFVFTSSSPLSASVDVSTQVRDPAGTLTSLPDHVGEWPVSVADGTGVGSYVVEIDVVIPPADGDTAWGTALRSEVLDLQSLSVAFTQTR